MMKSQLLVRKSAILSGLMVLVWFTPHFLYYRIPGGLDVLVLLRLLLNVWLIYYTGAVRRIERSRIVAILLLLLHFVTLAYGMIFVSGFTFGKIVRFLQFVTFTIAIIGIFGSKKWLARETLKAVQWIGVAYGILDLLIPSIKIGTGYGGEYFFTGSEASSVQLLSMMMILSAYYDMKEYGKIRIPTVIIGISEFLFAVQNESGQGRMMSIVFATLLLLDWITRGKVWACLKPTTVAVIVVFLNIATITLSFQNWPIAKFIIVDLLGKDMTLTGRDFIFTSCIGIFAAHPLLGYGYESSIVNDTLSRVFVAFDTAHNSILQMVINSGLVGVAAFVSILFVALNSIYKENESNKYIYFGIIALMAGGVVSMVLNTSYFWILLAIALSERMGKMIN